MLECTTVMKKGNDVNLSRLNPAARLEVIANWIRSHATGA
jgi:hypothetical protein